jgi:hypothetical protein
MGGYLAPLAVQHDGQVWIRGVDGRSAVLGDQVWRQNRLMLAATGQSPEQMATILQWSGYSKR